jgi:hypothetical protein
VSAFSFSPPRDSIGFAHLKHHTARFLEGNIKGLGNFKKPFGSERAAVENQMRLFALTPIRNSFDSPIEFLQTSI